MRGERTDGADLYNRLFVDEDIVRHAWRKGEETSRGQGLGLALIGRLAHPQTECPAYQNTEEPQSGQK